MFAVERESLQAVVLAIGHDDDGSLASRVHPNTMGTIQLARTLARTSKGANEFGPTVVLIDVTGSVSVGHVYVAVWRYRDIGRLIVHQRAVIFLRVRRGLCRIPQGEDLLTL